MRSSLFKGLLATVAVVVASSGAAWAHGGCSNASLRGDYGISITGEILPPAPAPTVLEAGVALQHFDGRGNLTQSDFITAGGVPTVPNDEFREGGTGSYTVNADCTGTATIYSTPVTPIEVKFVLVNEGTEFLGVVSSLALPPSGQVTPARITVHGKRVHALFPW